jgi:hypothetical protein
LVRAVSAFKKWQARYTLELRDVGPRMSLFKTPGAPIFSPVPRKKSFVSKLIIPDTNSESGVTH